MHFLKYLFMWFFIQPNLYLFEANKSRTSSLIKKAVLKVHVNPISYPKQGYGEVYKTKFEIDMLLRIFGRKKIKQQFELPRDFFEQEFLESLDIGQIVEYPDLKFMLEEKQDNDCYRALIKDVQIESIQNPELRARICINSDDLGFKEIDLSGIARGRNIQIGFDRVKELSDDFPEEPQADNLCPNTLDCF